MADPSKWKDLHDEYYEIVDLGRPAVFLVPSHLLQRSISTDDDAQTVEQFIEAYLMDHFGAFTKTMIPEFGFWLSGGKKKCLDECRRYEVSFLGKERICPLMRMLAQVARIVNEDCVYFKAGQHACLIYPKAVSHE